MDSTEKPPGSGKQVTMLKLARGESFVEQVGGGVGALVAKAAAGEETAAASCPGGPAV